MTGLTYKQLHEHIEVYDKKRGVIGRLLGKVDISELREIVRGKESDESVISGDNLVELAKIIINEKSKSSQEPERPILFLKLSNLFGELNNLIQLKEVFFLNPTVLLFLQDESFRRSFDLIWTSIESLKKVGKTIDNQQFAFCIKGVEHFLNKKARLNEAWLLKLFPVFSQLSKIPSIEYCSQEKLEELFSVVFSLDYDLFALLESFLNWINLCKIELPFGDIKYICQKEILTNIQKDLPPLLTVQPTSLYLKWLMFYLMTTNKLSQDSAEKLKESETVKEEKYLLHACVSFQELGVDTTKEQWSVILNLKNIEWFSEFIDVINWSLDNKTDENTKLLLMLKLIEMNKLSKALASLITKCDNKKENTALLTCMQHFKTLGLQPTEEHLLTIFSHPECLEDLNNTSVLMRNKNIKLEDNGKLLLGNLESIGKIYKELNQCKELTEKEFKWIVLEQGGPPKQKAGSVIVISPFWEESVIQKKHRSLPEKISEIGDVLEELYDLSRSPRCSSSPKMLESASSSPKMLEDASDSPEMLEDTSNSPKMS